MESKGHMEYIGNWEYFKDGSGELYRADKTNPLDCRTGFRMGGRFECPAHLVDMCLKLAKMPIKGD